MGACRGYFINYSSVLIEDRNPPAEKVKKRWNRLDGDDPNWEVNIKRVHYGKPPVDEWNIGVEYVYEGTPDPN